MKKVISFSLYGNNPMYTLGALCNAELSEIIFPGWVCRFYYGDSVPNDIIERLSEYSNVELIHMVEDGNHNYMTWRFLSIDDDDVEIMLSRDADSRLSFREKKLVDIFINSDFNFHDIRDCHLHNDVMGGTWGMKKNNKVNMKELLTLSQTQSLYGHDQYFLREFISPKFVNDSLLHNSEYNPTHGYYLNTFPIKFEEILSPLINPVHNPLSMYHYIGEVFPGDNYNKPLNHIFY